METSALGGDPGSVESPEVDVAELQAEVARQARALRGSHPSSATSPSRPGPRRPVLEGTAEISPFTPLSTRRPVAGAVGVAVRRAVRRGLRWYLWPVTARMSAHNRAVAGVVEAHRRELAALERDAERLRQDSMLVGRRR